MTLNTRAVRMLMVGAVAMLWTVGLAMAQPTFTNPPCPNVNVFNATGVPVQFNSTTNPPGIWPPVLIPPGGTITLPTPPGGIAFLAVTSFAGVRVPFNPPPPPPFMPCTPTDWWINSIALAPTGFCFDICANPLTCTITITGPAPPPCVNP